MKPLNRKLEELKHKLLFEVKISKKLVFSYFVLIIIPVAVLGIVAYQNFIQILVNQAVDSSATITVQINQSIDTYLKDVQTFSANVAYNDRVNEFIIGELGSHNLRTSEGSKSSLENLLYHYISTQKGIHSINIYCGDLTINAHNAGTLNHNYTPAGESHFIAANNRHGLSYIQVRNEGQFIENQLVISVTRAIYNMYSFGQIGTMVVDIDIAELRAHINKAAVPVNNRVLILDQNDMILFGSVPAQVGQSMTEYYHSFEVAEDGISYAYNSSGERILMLSTTSELTGWKAVLLTPYDELRKKGAGIGLVIIVVGIALAAASFIMAILISYTIVSPLAKLQYAFSTIERNEFLYPSPHYGGKNEIGQLWDGFYLMANRIGELIQQIMAKEDEKRQAQAKSLQMQISPHFLYNTLNSIRYLSMMHKDDPVTNMTNLLIGLLKGYANYDSDYVTVRQETEMLSRYIEIQKIRYLDKFDIVMEIDQIVLDKSILKFILQPLVENSIFHGLVSCEKKGEILVRINVWGDKIRVVVSDDGKGMDPSEIPRLLQDEERSDDAGHIGLRNINHRLKLFYGDGYTFDIDSAPGRGTIVTMELPQHEEGVADD